MTSECIAAFGTGAWGTALTRILLRNGQSVRLWGGGPGRRERLEREWSKEISTSPAIKIESDLNVLLRETSHILIAVPSGSFRATLGELHAAPHSTVVWATKGFDPGSGKLLSEVVSEVLGPKRARAVISGPTLASEVTRGLPAALTVASPHAATASMVAGWFRNDSMIVHTSADIVGVQIGGATKNVMAIASGISDGLGLGGNARAALITRGLEEVMRLAAAMGGRRDTFHGFSGIGDLVLTCTDDSSRNRRVGLGLGRGEKLTDVLAQIARETEGVAAARELHRLARRFEVEMPIVEQVYRVLYENAPPKESMESIFRDASRCEPALSSPKVLPLRSRPAGERPGMRWISTGAEVSGEPA
jgi:glycerol-3-phosphate dehydrogenase (NAD(P)+)